MAVIAIDAGTTGIRTIAYDSSAKPIASAYREFPQHFPAPGLVEHDLDEIWSTVAATLQEVVEVVGAASVQAVGITNQRETACIWDRRTGRPLHRAIVWQDRRTASRCAELAAFGLLELVRRTTGLVLDPYFSATKYEWLLRNVELDGTDPVLGTVDSWIAWKLTGGKAHVTDWSNASRTMLFDISKLAWSEQLCSELSIPVELLPEPVPSCSVVAHCDPRHAAGLEAPVAAIMGDQQAALFGQACFAPGMSKNTYGTGSFVLVNLGDRLPEPAKGLLTTVAWGLDRKPYYALEGSIFVTGAALQWLRDALGILESADQTETIASTVSDTEGVVFVPAFTGLGSPWWDPHARGLVLGITRGTTTAHLVRAAVEAMAYQTKDVVDAMEKVAGFEITELRVDGGASVMDLLCQFQADLLGVPVKRPRLAETTSLGAAFAAGLAVGTWKSVEELEPLWELEREFLPDSSKRSEMDRSYARWLEAVRRSRGWADDTFLVE